MKKRRRGAVSTKLSNKIRFERMKRNLSQERLAELAGLSKNGLSKIETGSVSPSIDTVEFLAEALGMDFLDLIDVSKVEL